MLVSRSTRKENPAAPPRFEAASEAGRQGCQKIWFGTPICVPSSPSTVSMATIGADRSSQLGATPGSLNGNDGVRWPTAPPTTKPCTEDHSKSK